MGQCPSILTGTDIEELLSGGKTKDHVAARKDLQEMGIRKPLHPVLSEDGAHHEIRAAIFDLSNKEKEIFSSVLENTKLSYGCASNIGRNFAIKKTTKAEVAVPLMKLSACLRALWSKGTRIDNAPLNGNNFRSNNDEDEDKDVDRYSLH
ncbi:hypothetical protein AgCh_007240 [Apium graveolens]